MRGRSRGRRNNNNNARGSRGHRIWRGGSVGAAFFRVSFFSLGCLGGFWGLFFSAGMGSAAAQAVAPTVGAPGVGAAGAYGGGGIAAGIGGAGGGGFAPAPGAFTTPYAAFGAAPAPAPPTAPPPPANAPLEIPQVPPAWILTPSLQLGEAFNDNVNLAPRGSRLWDFITTVSPSLTLTGQTARTNLALTYDPQELLFARTSPSNVLQQRLLGTGRAELWQQTLYVDGAASMGQAFTRPTGAVAPTTLTTNSNLSTVSSETVSPYLLQHLGNVADSESRYRFSYTSTTGTTGSGGTGIAPETTHELRETLASGELFGRLGWQLLGDATRLERGQAAGDPFSGITSKDELVRSDFKYPVYQALGVTGGIGYERITDPTLSSQPKGIIWDAGLTYQPNPLVSATLTYGQRFGRNDIEFNGTYNLDPQLRVSAIYTQTIQTSQSQIAGCTANTTFTGTGTTTTGANNGFSIPCVQSPLASSTAGTNPSGVFGVSSGSFLAKTGELDAVLTKERNTYELLVYESKTSGNQTLTGAATPATVTAERVFGGNVNWSHLLREDLSSTASAGWYRTLYLDGSGRRDNVYVLSIGLTYNLSRTTTATLSLLHSDQRSNIESNSLLDNIIMGTVQKQF